MEITQNIKKLRELKGFSQEFMAEKMGISQVAYSKIERDAKNLNFEKIEKIASILEISVIDLMNFNEKLIFNNCNNTVYGGTLYAYSEKERELYESKIEILKKQLEDKDKQLEEKDKQIKFLEELVHKFM